MTITNIEDLRQMAKERLPDVIYSYIRNGGYEEETLERNREDLKRFVLVPRVLNNVSQRTTSKELFGETWTMPVGLAPVGACGLAYPNGEIEVALAAKAFGVPFCLSTLSISSIEDVAEATKCPFWFQLYMMKDSGVTNGLVQRARDAGCSTLILSFDLHVRSQRHGEQKHGLVAPPSVDLPNVMDALSHPSWLFSMVHSHHRTFGNLIGLKKNAKNVAEVTEWLEDQYDSTLGVKDIEWARKVWPGKLLVKGVLHPDDARQCINAGADGVIISNHGGRQVDGAVSTVSILPRVVDAVAGKGTILADSGIRSGIDVLKMLARGADGCLVGRAYMYGLAAEGGKGVTKALHILQKELDQNMALCGQTSLDHLPTDLLVEHELLLDSRTKDLNLL